MPETVTPKEILQLGKRGTMPQGPLSTWFFPTPRAFPQRFPGSGGLGPAAGAGKGWGSSREPKQRLRHAAPSPGKRMPRSYKETSGGSGLPPQPGESERRGPFLPAPAGREKRADRPGSPLGSGAAASCSLRLPIHPPTRLWQEAEAEGPGRPPR